MNDLQPGSFTAWAREVFDDEPNEYGPDDFLEEEECPHGVSLNDFCEDCDEEENPL